MNDCPNVSMREALPDLLHGALPSPRLILVQDHLSTCMDCAEELALIRAVLATAVAPRVNATVIAAAIPAYRRPSRLGGLRASRYLQIAAAALIGVVGISTAVVRHNGSSRIGVPAAITSSRAAATASAASLLSGVALVSTADISDDHLAQLIKDMDNLDAFPPVDPEPVEPVAYESGA